jgi:SAM-dependent methyltransferase
VSKGRDSGMPAVEQWESDFEVAAVLDSLGCRDVRGDAVEFGCGYGTFTIPLARRTRGRVFALDIDPLMLAATAARTLPAGLKNILTESGTLLLKAAG